MLVFYSSLVLLGTLFTSFITIETFTFEQQCGKLNESQVRNGERITELDEHPWIARIEFTDSLGNRDFGCVGALIGPRHVVTAAHCLTGFGREVSAVILGDWDSSNDITERDCNPQDSCAPPPQRIDHKTLTLHPDYTTDKIDNDIAVIELARNVEISNYVQPICLPTAEEVSSGTDDTTLQVSGFLTPKKRAIPKRIKMPFQKVSTEECRKKDGHNVIATSNICGITDFQPLSGAPLIDAHGGDPRRFHLVGVAAAGFPSEPSMHLHTNVHLHRDWILQNTKI
ncbi:phenoloxidase-activating factor 3 [Drosophila miranda]|uniref:phenoloxidase-activating factor 3 n=1 Tax=Drosophila miranda TaxID=7229 RepID=UPI0007E6AB1D|nr:phenoloxidase-activating factor 3 [Drosophila miranda]